MLRRGAERLWSVLARQAVAPLQQSREVKRSTYLTGLPVDPDAEAHTVNFLNAVVAEAEEKLPAECSYRTAVQQYAKNFLKVINESGSQEAAEDKLGKQFEEIMVDCTKELELIDLMAAWKPWQQPQDREIRVFADLKDIPANVRAFREFQAEIAQKQELGGAQ